MKIIYSLWIDTMKHWNHASYPWIILSSIIWCNINSVIGACTWNVCSVRQKHCHQKHNGYKHSLMTWFELKRNEYWRNADINKNSDIYTSMSMAAMMYKRTSIWASKRESIYEWRPQRTLMYIYEHMARTVQKVLKSSYDAY